MPQFAHWGGEGVPRMNSTGKLSHALPLPSKGRLNSKAVTWYHPTDDTSPDLASLGHPPQRGGQGPGESADFLSVEHGFDEGALPVAEGEQEKGGILPQ